MATAIIPVSYITNENYLTKDGEYILSGWDTIPSSNRAARNNGPGKLLINQSVLSENIPRNWIISGIRLKYNAWVALAGATYYVRAYVKGTDTQYGSNIATHNIPGLYSSTVFSATIPISYYNPSTRQLNYDLAVYSNSGAVFNYMNYLYFEVDYTETDTYVIAVDCNSSAGIVSVSPNDGEVDPLNPNNVTISATANEGYTFNKWITPSGSTFTTDSTYTIPAASISQNIKYTAKFAKNTNIRIGESTIPTDIYIGKHQVKDVYVGKNNVYKKGVI